MRIPSWVPGVSSEPEEKEYEKKVQQRCDHKVESWEKQKELPTAAPPEIDSGYLVFETEVVKVGYCMLCGEEQKQYDLGRVAVPIAYDIDPGRSLADVLEADVPEEEGGRVIVNKSENNA